jgi:hypothetical protein
MWIGDWKSTGLKSRTTVHNGLKHLRSLELLTTRRDGHRILYEMLPLQGEHGEITTQSLRWHGILYPVSRTEKRQRDRRIRSNIEQIFYPTKFQIEIAKLLERTLADSEKLWNLPESKSVRKILKDIGIDAKDIPLSRLEKFVLRPNLDETLCLNCLKRGRITYLVFDHVGGQVICPIEGTIREFSETDYKFVLSRKIWHTEYLYRRVNFECPNCHHINRIYVERKLIPKRDSDSGHLTVFPMYKCQETKHCTKCGALVAQSGLSLRIRRKQ